MNDERFLEEFCDERSGDYIDMNDLYFDYFKAAYCGTKFEQLDCSSKLITNQKLDINTYIKTVR